MKKRTKRKIIAGAISGLAIFLAASWYFSKDKKSDQKEEIISQIYDWTKSEKDDDETKTIADKAYDLVTKDISENELSEMEIITQEMINSGDFQNPDEDSIEFVIQMEKQCEEYCDNYELDKSKEGLKNINKMIYDFIYSNQDFHGIYFRDLNLETQQEIFKLATEIVEMNSTHSSKNKEEFKKNFNGIVNNVKILSKRFNHVE